MLQEEPGRTLFSSMISLHEADQRNIMFFLEEKLSDPTYFETMLCGCDGPQKLHFKIISNFSIQG